MSAAGLSLPRIRGPSRPAPPAPASDAALVARVARSDDAALGTLYDRHNRVAYAIALRVVRDRGLAEDAVQDAFLSVWKGAHSFRSEQTSVRGWILMLVHRRAVDLVRREQRRRSDVLDERHERGDDAAGPADEASLVGLREQVQRALGFLPDAQREVLELAYYGGLTQTEVAARVDAPLGTVKSRTSTALTALRRALADDADLAA